MKTCTPGMGVLKLTSVDCRGFLPSAIRMRTDCAVLSNNWPKRQQGAKTPCGGFCERSLSRWALAFFATSNRGFNLFRMFRQDAFQRTGLQARGCRLLDQFANPQAFRPLLIFELQIAGGEDDGNFLADTVNLARQFKAGEVRHGKVGDDNVEFPRIGAKLLQRSEGIGKAGDAISVALE